MNKRFPKNFTFEAVRKFCGNSHTSNDSEKEQDKRGKRRLRKFIKIIGFVSVLLGLILTYIQIRYMAEDIKSNVNQCELNNFLVLRNQYHEMRKGFPSREQRYLVGSDSKDSSEWEKIQDYWNHAHDEWIFSRNLNSEILKDDYYGPATAYSLDYKQADRTCLYVSVLEDLWRREYWPTGHQNLKDEFCIYLILHLCKINATSTNHTVPIPDFLFNTFKQIEEKTGGSALIKKIDTNNIINSNVVLDPKPSRDYWIRVVSAKQSHKMESPNEQASAEISVSSRVADGSIHEANSAVHERNEIFMLLTYSIVAADWQTSDSENPRGHNIGAILVDNETLEPVHWSCNSNAKYNDSTQHAEVRLIQQFISQNNEIKYLDKYTVYTTLEPCAMCSGMMCLTKVSDIIYGQSDTGFGNTFERLALDSTKCLGDHGYSPYPRLPNIVAKTSLGICKRLETENQKYAQTNPDDSITSFLSSKQAERIYFDAINQFQNFKTVFPENEAVYKRCIDFYNKNFPEKSVIIKSKASSEALSNVQPSLSL